MIGRMCATETGELAMSRCSNRQTGMTMTMECTYTVYHSRSVTFHRSLGSVSFWPAANVGQLLGVQNLLELSIPSDIANLALDAS